MLTCRSCRTRWPLWPMLKKFPDYRTASCPKCGVVTPWAPRVVRLHWVLLGFFLSRLSWSEVLFGAVAVLMVGPVFDDYCQRRLAPVPKDRSDALDYRAGPV